MKQGVSLCAVVLGLGATVLGAADYAVVIGIADYRHNEAFEPAQRIRFADEDADAFYQWLIDPERGNFRRSNVTRLVDSDATAEAIARALSDVGTRIQASDRIFVFFSGHGVLGKRGRAYLLPFDGHPENPFQYSALRVDRFLDDLETEFGHADLVVFLDACHSGAPLVTESDSEPAPGGKGWASGFNTELNEAVERIGPEISAFFSSEGAEKSWEDAAVGHGLFTYYLLRGLDGLADGEANLVRDGRVTVEELRLYLRVNVPTHAMDKFGQVQTPRASNDAQQELVLSSVPSVEEDEAKLASQWQLRQRKMESEWEDVKDRRARSTRAWLAELDAFGDRHRQDNPFSSRDDELRSKVRRKMEELVALPTHSRPLGEAIQDSLESDSARERADAMARLLAAHYDAVGGRDRVERVQSAQMVGELHQGSAKCGLKIVMERPRKTRYDITCSGKRVIYASDGTSGWSQEGTGSPTKKLSKEKIKSIPTIEDLFELASGVYKNPVLSGFDDRGPRELYEIAAKDRSGDETYLYIDAATMLISRTESVSYERSKPVKIKQGRSETTLPFKFGRKVAVTKVNLVEDYRDIEGLKLPFRTTRTKDGEPTQAYVLSEVRLNVSISPRYFSRP